MSVGPCPLDQQASIRPDAFRLCTALMLFLVERVGEYYVLGITSGSGEIVHLCSNVFNSVSMFLKSLFYYCFCLLLEIK